jgi:hypothetical protein
MVTRFVVKKATRIASANVFLLDGNVLQGCLKSGDIVHREGNDETTIRVKSIALVNTKAPSDLVTVSIEDPGFPIAELEGAELVGPS